MVKKIAQVAGTAVGVGVVFMGVGMGLIMLALLSDPHETVDFWDTDDEDAYYYE